MAQKREKDEPLELKVPADSLCPEKLPAGPCSALDPTRTKPSLKRPRSEDLRLESAEPQPTTTEQTAEEPSTVPKKKAVNRCSGCRKKVGLTGFRCRCGDLFCSEHRYSDRHDCSYDYKTAGREAIARENPVVKAPKILKV